MGLPAKAGFIVKCNVHGTPTGKTHLWSGSDTACRMWSTGGLLQHKRWDYYIEPPSELCTLCHPERHGVSYEPPLFKAAGLGVRTDGAI
jgi:hypothetical protein